MRQALNILRLYKKLPAGFLPVAAILISLCSSACDNREHHPINANEPVELRVMTFNIEWGGTNVSFKKVVEAIRRSQTDIVGIQEAEGNLRRLAADLGWHYDERNYAMSRFPLLDPPGADGRYVLVEVEPGKVVVLANVHLPSDPDGMALIRDGATPDEVLQVERETRLPKIVPFLRKLKPLIEDDMPVFLTGDFNSPAHSDWTEAMVGIRPYLLYAMDWPVSRAVEDTGFRDSWRTSHPDPTKDPGLTWWARRPPLELYEPGENDPEDRIDFVWFAGPVDVVSSQIVGEAGMPGVNIGVEPWPSDHRGVVSRFTVVPAEISAIVTTRHRVYRVGESIEVLYRQAANAEVRIERVRSNNETVFVAGDSVKNSGKLVYAADRFTAGHYRIYVTLSKIEFLAREFWVLDRDAPPTVDVIGDLFDSGEAIEIAWRNAPGYRNDYLSIVAKGATANYDGGLTWLYVDAKPEGRVKLDAATAEWGWPIQSGTYVARLMKDDGDEVLAESAPFRVR